jgi:hypothetical protein
MDRMGWFWEVWIRGDVLPIGSVAVCRLIFDLGLGKRSSNRVRCCVEMDFMNRGVVEEV